MNVRNHRIAAGAILAVGLLGVVAWGRSMAVDSDEVQAVRARFQGHWVASAIEAGAHRKLDGPAASRCTATFDGKSVSFQGMVGDFDASGTYYIESSHPNWVDFKLAEGWIVGIFAFEGDTLKLCLNPFALPERLGVPTLPRPKGFFSGEVRHLYEFRKATGPG